MKGAHVRVTGNPAFNSENRPIDIGYLLASPLVDERI